MTKVLYDANVVLDVLFHREPFWPPSSVALAQAGRGKVEGYISAHAVTTLAYLLETRFGSSKSKRLITELLMKLHIAPVTDAVVRRALAGPMRDFEDAVTHEAALEARVSVIVTRDISGFRQSRIPVVLPEALQVE